VKGISVVGISHFLSYIADRSTLYSKKGRHQTHVVKFIKS